MPRIFLPVGAIACWTLLTVACNDEAKIIDESGVGGNQAGSGGRSGATGVGGSMAGAAGDGASGSAGDGAGGSAGDGASGSAGDGAGGSDEPPDAGPDSGDASAPSVSCSVDSDCVNDDNLCTIHDCNPSGVCVTGNAAVGTLCGSPPGLCSGQDTCNNAGACLPNHTPNLVCDSADEGTDDDGHCTEAGVCDCASERLTAPDNTQWVTGSGDPDILKGECETCDSSPDHIVVFTAPSAGTFRFSAEAFDGGDALVAVFNGDCAPVPETSLGCNDDVVGADAGSGDSQLDVALNSGQVVTVLVTTPCETEGGDGNLSIELL